MSQYTAAGSGEVALALNVVGHTPKVHCRLGVERQEFRPEEDHEPNSMKLVNSQSTVF